MDPYGTDWYIISHVKKIHRWYLSPIILRTEAVWEIDILWRFSSYPDRGGQSVNIYSSTSLVFILNLTHVIQLRSDMIIQNLTLLCSELLASICLNSTVFLLYRKLNSTEVLNLPLLGYQGDLMSLLFFMGVNTTGEAQSQVFFVSMTLFKKALYRKIIGYILLGSVAFRENWNENFIVLKSLTICIHNL